MKIKRGLLIVIGCIGVVFGAIGAILPLIPAFPFLLLATICFTKSSKRLNDWFVSTKLYKSNLESFVKMLILNVKMFQHKNILKMDFVMVAS